MLCWFLHWCWLIWPWSVGSEGCRKGTPGGGLATAGCCLRLSGVMAAERVAQGATPPLLHVTMNIILHHLSCHSDDSKNMATRAHQGP